MGGTIVLTLILCEFLLRILGYSPTHINPLNAFHKGDPKLGWIGVENYTGRFKKQDFDVLISTDSEGFRLNDINTNDNEILPTIIILGDSFTWGWGVENNQIFSYKLQRELINDFNIKNLGMNGYGNIQELILLKRTIENSSIPKQVFVMVFKNDFIDNIDKGNESRPYLEIDENSTKLMNTFVKNPIGGTLKNIKRNSYLLSYLSYSVHLYKLSKQIEKSNIEIINSNQNKDNKISYKAKKGMEYALNKFNKLAIEHKFDLNIVYIPSIGDDFSKNNQSPYRKAIRNITNKNNIKLIDLTEAYTENFDNYYLEHDEHWNTIGHSLAATILRKHISK